MFNSIGLKTNLQQIVKYCIFLFLLLPSISAFAQTPATPLDEATQAKPANQQAASPRIVYKSKSITRRGTTFRKASTVDLSSTKKVTKDDFGRLPLTVRQHRDTSTIWLGQQSRANKPSTPKTTWLGRKKGSD